MKGVLGRLLQVRGARGGESGIFLGVLRVVRGFPQSSEPVPGFT